MFQGSITALVSPMTSKGQVDFDAYQRFIDWQITEGTNGIVPVGTTGESPTLTEAEHEALIKAAVEAAAGRVPVMAGTGSNATDSAIAITQYAKSVGADAALVVTPYYNKPSQEGLYAHFRAIHDATDIPIYIYNIPGRSVVDMSVGTMARLAALPRIAGLKDATGDLARIPRTLAACGEGFTQLSGEDMTAVGFNAMGGRGCISVTSNVAPKLCSDMQAASLAGDLATAQALQAKLADLHDAMFLEPSPAPVKYALSLLGKCTDFARLPIMPLSQEARGVVRAAMKKAGLLFD